MPLRDSLVRLLGRFDGATDADAIARAIERGGRRRLEALLVEAWDTVSPPLRVEIEAAILRTATIGYGQGWRMVTRRPYYAPPAGTPVRYVLHVGTVEPRKNVGLLLAAWEAWVAEDPAAPALLLCGRRGWKSGALHAAFGRAAEAGWLRRPGYVDDDALAALYRGALAVVCPSRYEGFGLPLIGV